MRSLHDIVNSEKDADGFKQFQVCELKVHFFQSAFALIEIRINFFVEVKNFFFEFLKFLIPKLVLSN